MSEIVLEKEVPFSESLLWKLQAEAYQGFGISAWSQKGVPSYLTAHPLTARGYAKTTLGFLQDIQNKQRLDCRQEKPQGVGTSFGPISPNHQR